MLAALVSCQKEDPFKPGTDIKSADWYSVPSSGTTIEKDDIALELPAGLFEGSSKIAVTPVKQGSIAGDDERSPFYQIAFESNKATTKSFEVKLMYAGDPDEVQAVVQTPVFAHSVGTIMNDVVVPVAYSISGGEVTVTVPELLKSSSATPYFTIGLIKKSDMTVSTKASLPDITYLIIMDSKHKPAAQTMLNHIVPDAFDDLRTLGFNPNFWFLGMMVFDTGKDEWGFAQSACSFSSWNWLILNSKKLVTCIDKGSPKDMVDELEQTVVHELFHLVHDQFYDPRLGIGVAIHQGYGDEWLSLSEAVAVWTEQSAGNKQIADLAPKNAPAILSSLFPYYKTQGSISESTQVYQNHGYGLGLLIQYLSKKTTKKSIREILEFQKAGATSLFDAFDKFCKAHNLAVFTTDGYFSFLMSLLNGEVDSRVSGKINMSLSESTTIKNATPVVCKDTVNAYGASLRSIIFRDEAFKVIDDSKEMKISQENESLITYVKFVDEGRYSDLGKATAGAPFHLSVETVRGICAKYHTPIVLITVWKEQNGYLGQSMKMSNLKIEFVKPEKPVVDVYSMSIDFTLNIKKVSDDYTYVGPASRSHSWYANDGTSTVTTAIENGMFVIRAVDSYYNENTLFVEFELDGKKLGDIHTIQHSYEMRPVPDGYKESFILTAGPIPKTNENKDIIEWEITGTDTYIDYSGKSYWYHTDYEWQNIKDSKDHIYFYIEKTW